MSTENSGGLAYDPSQEVRFAVVMYGGVSLAIYMSGVAQELLRAVRGTADLGAGAELAGTELVYREIGQRLFHGRRPGDTSITDEIRTRIVVDVLSGTSAGGINGVFLAKALARKNKDLKNLHEMWLEEADVGKLLNDQRPCPRTSLLDGQRMYDLLLKALNEMDSGGDRDESAAPLVDQVDLFVTATDLIGLEAPIGLSDKPADERIHRSVFHFRSGAADAGDFEPRFNRMLAFAARATSSFPAVFEPTTFASIQPTAEEQREYARFFERYACRGVKWASRPFADGGSLDNRPFSYAIDAIKDHDCALPVVRKLLFLDSSPEHAGGSIAAPAQFNFVENAMAALVTLPGYETIRDDIERVNERNRYLSRLRELRARLTSDQVWERLPAQPVPDFADRDLNFMIEKYGPNYAAYHHIKVFGVTDWLARVATGVMGFNPESDEYGALRLLLCAWREDHYAANPGAEAGTQGKLTENRFLLDFDIEFRLRRLHYLREGIDQRLRESTGEVTEALRNCRHGVQYWLAGLLRYRRELESRTASPLAGEFQSFDYRISGEDLHHILEPPSGDYQMVRARQIYQRLKPMFERAAATLAETLKAKFTECSDEMKRLLAPLPDLQNRYAEFERRDCVMWPFLAGTNISEAGEVGIFRVGPADTDLYPAGLARREGKLAGIQLGHFGAFLSKEWRANDIMWGRLDGAERIITALLPDPEDRCLREDLTATAQAEILKQALTADRLFAWLAQYVKERVGPRASVSELKAAVAALIAGAKTDPATVILRDLLGGGRSVSYLRFASRFYQMPSHPDHRTLSRWARRAAGIVGGMLSDLNFFGPVLASLKTELWVLRKLLSWLSDLWTLRWLYAMAFGLVIVSGTLKHFGSAGVGWMVIGASTAAIVLRAISRDYFEGGVRWKRALGILAVLAGRRVSSTLRHPAWEFTDFLPLSFGRVEPAC